MAYDCDGITVTDRVPLGSSVTGHYYANFLRQKLRPKIRQDRSQLLEAGVLPLRRLRVGNTAYSPHMSPDFDLFPQPKELLCDQRFQSLETVNAAATDVSDSLTPVDN
jgi:hypothetical protein